MTFCGRRSRARRHPARLLAQSGEVKFGVQRVGERHPVEYRPRVVKELHEKKRDERGFTLIELLVVITLLFHEQLRHSQPQPN
jgi:hypothetical protein